jgi:hypothetical protein
MLSHLNNQALEGPAEMPQCGPQTRKGTEQLGILSGSFDRCWASTEKQSAKTKAHKLEISSLRSEIGFNKEQQSIREKENRRCLSLGDYFRILLSDL